MKSIFITGASSGIGRETAILFANQGWFVGITDVNGFGLERLKRSLESKIGFSALMDVTDPAQVAAVLSEFNQAAGGKLDVLLNNAGILRVKPFENIPLADHHAIIDINIKGYLNCAYLAFPYLVNNPGSRLINMASVSSIIAAPNLTTYSASKFWVRGFTEALNIEWERHQIRVCDIMPNFVNTPMVEHNPGKIVDNVGVSITARDVADTVWKAAHSTRVHWIIDSPQNKLFYKLRGFVPYSIERAKIKKKSGL